MTKPFVCNLENTLSRDGRLQAARLHRHDASNEGSFTAAPLEHSLKHLALQSAFHDKRFPPMQEHELEYLECTVSILEKFEVISSPMDWQIGIHGLIVEWDAYRATFLPSVAEQQGWSKQETLEHLIRKAGYHAKMTEEEKCKLKIMRYQSRASSSCFAEYRERQRKVSREI